MTLRSQLKVKRSQQGKQGQGQNNGHHVGIFLPETPKMYTKWRKTWFVKKQGVGLWKYIGVQQGLQIKATWVHTNVWDSSLFYVQVGYTLEEPNTKIVSTGPIHDLVGGSAVFRRREERQGLGQNFPLNFSQNKGMRAKTASGPIWSFLVSVCFSWPWF